MAELNETMSVTEFLRWMAFAAIEPFGEVRADWRAAMAMAQQANMHRPKGRAPVAVQQFLPRFGNRPAGQPMQQMEIALRAQFARLGGKLAES